MEKLTRIVVPVDGSAASDRGVDFAASFAQSEHATIAVCSVADEASVILPIAEGALVNPGPLIEAIEMATAQHVDDAVTRLRARGVTAQGTVLHGNPVMEVDAFARRQHADAIVLGTNGRGGIERLFMGSVTSALLRIADVPVVTVHADDALQPGPILVAIDASPASFAALAYAMDRARLTGVSLQLLHVLEESRIDRLSTALHLQPHGARRRALADAEAALEDAADRVRAAGVTFTSEIDRGTPVDAILTAAERHGAGSIALGTHGRGGLERLILGSVAAGVVCRAQVPVYVVHRRGVRAADAQRDVRDSEARVPFGLAGAVAWQHTS